MMIPRSALLLAIYGVLVLASGVFRFVGAAGGEKGLWFGLVMGGLALAAALLAARGRSTASLVCALPSLTLVGGWFAWEVFVLKGLPAAETRQLLVLAATLLTATLLPLARRLPPPTG